MSATDWRQCPRCLKNRKAEVNAGQAAIEQSYGQVPFGEYEAAKLSLKNLQAQSLEESLRIDSEQGIDDDGKFYSSFRAICRNCDFEFSHNHEQPVNI